MSRTYAHKPFAVVEREQYGEAVYWGPRKDPNNPWEWFPGQTERGMPWWRHCKHHASTPADSAGVREQRKAMRRKRRQQDHMLTRDPERYEDMPTPVEKIDKWALPSW